MSKELFLYDTINMINSFTACQQEQSQPAENLFFIAFSWFKTIKRQGQSSHQSLRILHPEINNWMKKSICYQQIGWTMNTFPVTVPKRSFISGFFFIFTPLCLNGQCCGSGMFIPDPDFLPIPDPGSKNLIEREG